MWFKKRPAGRRPDANLPIKVEDSTFDPRSRELVLARADAHMKLGELGEAERCFRLVLDSDPRHSGALINLGFVLKELRRSPESVDFIDRALRVAPDNADAHYLRGTLHQAAGNLVEAAFHLEKAVALRPDFEFAYRELVVTLFRMGRVAEAARWCISALEVLPNCAELHFYRSNLYKHANATDAAILSARTALKLQSGLIAARSSLSELLINASQENVDNSLERTQKIAEGYADLGVAYLASYELDTAQAAFERAVALAPAVAEHHYKLGSVLTMQGDVAEARVHLDRAIDLDPEHIRARFARSLMYAAPFPESPSAAKGIRSDILAGLDEFSLWSEGRVLQPEQFVGFNSLFYLSYQEQDNLPALKRYGSLCARAMERSPDHRPAVPIVARPVSGRMRIGIVSADIRDHSVWFALIKGWLEHFDRNRFEIAIFSLPSTPDRETEWAKLHADSFVSGTKSIWQWVDSISELNPAALIYPAIGMDLLTSQLASLRLAPTQINAWGHPDTSGFPTIDLYLSGELFEPADAQQFYSEKLVPLLNLGNCYEGRVRHSVEPDLDALGIDSTRPILICSGTAFKYQIEHDRVMTQIASRIEGSQLIFFRQRPESLSDRLKERLERAFSQAGLDFDKHVRFIPTQPLNIFHGLLSRAHLALDTIGFSGYNTAIQAIESGLPLVTREGKFLRGRLASGILRRIGMTELIAQTTDEYVSLAAKLIEDAEFQKRVRSDILRRRAVLYNDVAAIRHLESVLEGHIER
jgi:protein O-GlcNAc transferase